MVLSLRRFRTQVSYGQLKNRNHGKTRIPLHGQCPAPFEAFAVTGSSHRHWTPSGAFSRALRTSSYNCIPSTLIPLEYRLAGLIVERLMVMPSRWFVRMMRRVSPIRSRRILNHRPLLCSCDNLASHLSTKPSLETHTIMGIAFVLCLVHLRDPLAG